ncbi:MAG: arylsulfatase [Acidobacteria bacterium]|nr:arylsulfatase [Acidobacteriota bacterium]
MNRRHFLSITAASLATGATAQTLNTAKPNIIFILADDLGYGDLGCYGQQLIDTSNIDRLAAEGMRFTDAYAGSTVCAPSRSCLMTGQHTGHTRVRNNGSPTMGRVSLWHSDVTVAEVLNGAGYSTSMIGKWGIGEAGSTGVPTQQGFDEWFGYLNQGHAHNFYPEHLWRNDTEVFLAGNRGGLRQQYSHDLFADEAIEFLSNHSDGPFLLYLPLTIPHANNELGRATGDGMEVPDYGPYAEKNWPTTEKGFAAMITRMDRDIGRIMAKLKELGIDDNTIVFFSSDNGPHREGGHTPDFFGSQGGLRGIKRDLYEGGIRVPTIARWPGKIQAGAVSDHPWAFWDFLPTAAELAGAPIPGNIDGISIVPTLLGKDQPGPDYLYWEFILGKNFHQAVRKGHWKAVRHDADQPIELYDLAADQAESHNVAAEHPDIVRQMEGILAKARSESEAYPIPA